MIERPSERKNALWRKAHPNWRQSRDRIIYLVALVSLVLIARVTWQLVHLPDVGASWHPWNGVVFQVDRAGPAAGRIEVGDRIALVDGLPVSQFTLDPSQRSDDVVLFSLERNGENLQVAVVLSPPSPAEIVERLVPVLVGLAFLVTGTIVLAFSPSQKQGYLFFLMCQFSGAVLACGTVAGYGPLWVGRFFGYLLWWLGPLIVHFHFCFPFSISSPAKRYGLVLLYLLAFLGTAIEIVIPASFVQARSLLRLIRYSWLGVNMCLVVALLGYAYRRAILLPERLQIGRVVLGGILAVLMFLVLSLFPEAILSHPILPHSVSFLFLLAIPLAYGYAILHDRLLSLDRYISRAATSILVLVLLSGLYLLANTIVVQLIPGAAEQRSLANLLLVLLLAVSFNPLYHSLRQIINGLFYGGWYDYRTAIQQLSQRMAQSSDDISLPQTFVQTLQTTMQLECVCLLLLDKQEKTLTVAGIAGYSCPFDWASFGQLSSGGSLIRYLCRHEKAIETRYLRRALQAETMDEQERFLLHCERAHLWLPLLERQRMIGLLILGDKKGKGGFSTEDLAILEVIARQAGIALQNIRLTGELRQQLRNVERLHQEVVRVREEERKYVARELHDQVIQDLIGLNYSLSELRTTEIHSRGREEIVRLQEQVRHVLEQVRRICGELRPPTLDSLGLVSAIRAHIRNWQTQNTPQVTLKVEGDESQELPEEVALTLYRVMQEALVNVQKHAGASKVSIAVRLDPHQVLLTVEDNGQGFLLPLEWGTLLNDGHFGLVGLQERLEMVKGKLTIQSQPGKGTRLEAWVPLYTNHDPKDQLP
jgi:signal transduction histidine kinase